MAVKIRLTRMGSKKRPSYRIVATDSRRSRDGEYIELVGFYNPISTPAEIKVNEEVAAKEAKAKEIAKALYTEKGFKGNLICTYTKQVLDGEPTAFTVDYTPSKSSRVGSYLVFGIERG